jgi:hypothetical protein
MASWAETVNGIRTIRVKAEEEEEEEDQQDIEGMAEESFEVAAFEEITASFFINEHPFISSSSRLFGNKKPFINNSPFHYKDHFCHRHRVSSIWYGMRALAGGFRVLAQVVGHRG